MITCPKCCRFVKVDTVLVNYMGDVLSVLATCSKCGDVHADWTDYDELGIGYDHAEPTAG